MEPPGIVWNIRCADPLTRLRWPTTDGPFIEQVEARPIRNRVEGMDGNWGMIT